MTTSAKGHTLEELEARHKHLTGRAQALEKSATMIDADLEAHRRALREQIDKCKEAGFDPNDLGNEISRFMEVLALKLDTYEADIKAGESLIAPMMEELRSR